MNYKIHYFRNNKAIFVVIPAVLFIAAVIIIVSVVGNSRKNASVAIGIDYIQSMEARDTVEIENNIFNASKKKMLDEIDLKMKEDPDYVWTALSNINTVMMGDSRVVGFDVFGFMDPSHVLAKAGATIHLIPDYYEDLKVLNPNLVLVSYGMNDMNSYWIWENLDEYIAELNDTMTTLTEMLPNAYIYVQSIVPSEEWTWEDSPGWAKVYDWNDAIRANCEEKGWRYLDLTDLMAAHSDLYDLDGIHIQYAFYPYWAQALLMRYLEDTMTVDSLAVNAGN